MDKLDLKKTYKALYAAKEQPALIEVPELHYLMVDGHGDPNDNPLFTDGMGAVYGLAYTLKFMLKKQSVADYAVMSLQGLWWAEDPGDFPAGARDRWQWTLMILQPDFVTPELVEAARVEMARKKAAARLEEVRLERLAEGLCAQVLHVGPYSEEGPTIARLHTFIAAQGRRACGKHHEIYLSDPRRTMPEKMKTIIRQPVE
jgi:hypothetical protein